MNIQTERTEYNNQKVIKLLFDYNKEIVAKIRTIPGVRWSRSMSCWYIADLPQKITALQNIGINVEQKSITNAIANNAYSELLIRFSDYMKARRYSSNTINSYVECMRIFLNFYSQKHYLEIDNKDVDYFNRNYILKKKLSATYQGQFINAIKLSYAKIPRKKLVIDYIERPRAGSPLPKVLSKEDVAKLLNSTENIKQKTMLSFRVITVS